MYSILHRLLQYNIALTDYKDPKNGPKVFLISENHLIYQLVEINT